MRQSRVESDIEHAVHLGGVGFWQEIAPARYKAALARLATLAGARVHGIAAECPVTLNATRWKVESDVIHPMHPGRAAVTPSRKCVEVRTHDTHTNEPICFLGTHYISGAWSRNHMLTRAWRRSMWNLHHAKMIDIVAAAHLAGYTVVIGMDANRHVDSLKYHVSQMIVASHGIDGLIVVPRPGLTVEALDKQVAEGLFTDHKPVSVTARLHRA